MSRFMRGNKVNPPVTKLLDGIVAEILADGAGNNRALNRPELHGARVPTLVLRKQGRIDPQRTPKTGH